MKKNLVTSALSACTFLAIMFAVSCSKNGSSGDETIVGTPGTPRFNLQFTNANNVDLDLHVITPSGQEISYLNPTANGGVLDVDCLCGDCPQGPNENIYWTAGTAPKGTYKYWVQYYDECGNGGSTSSTFTLRRIDGNTVIEKFTGTLSSGKSQVRTFVLN